MSRMLDGQVVLLTGAGSGIGQAAAWLAAEEGAEAVVLADISSEAIEQTIARWPNTTTRAEPLICNLTEASAAGDMVDFAMKTFGRLDSAINSAGIYAPAQNAVDVEDEFFDQVLDLNLTALFRSVRAQLRVMTAARRGSIVNVASAAALQPRPGQTAYTASKSGVLGLSSVVAVEAGPFGVRVNSVCPGRTMTERFKSYAEECGFTDEQLGERIALQRPASPKEIAEPIVWLCSDRSSYITGAVIQADGGRV